MRRRPEPSELLVLSFSLIRPPDKCVATLHFVNSLLQRYCYCPGREKPASSLHRFQAARRQQELVHCGLPSLFSVFAWLADKAAGDAALGAGVSSLAALAPDLCASFSFFSWSASASVMY